VFKSYTECIRLKDWWNYIVPPIIGFYLWGIYQAQLKFTPSLIQSIGFLLLTFSVASFGFFLNEWTDIKDDRSAGKKNRVAILPVSQRIVIFIFIVFQIAAGYYMSVYSFHASLLFILQLLLLVLYSCPPFRLKKNLYLAPLFDALFSGTLFYLLAINVSYSTFFFLALHQKIALCMLSIWALTRGFRNIIIHFLADVEFDTVIAQKTIGTHYDLSNTQNFLKWVLLPVEIISFSIFAFVGRDLCGITLGIFYLLFMIYWLNREKYIIPYLVKRNTEKIQTNIYDVNLFHEVLLPVIICVFLIIRIDILYLIYLVFILLSFSEIRKWMLNILLFPFSIIKL
jgi:hypothetical protein